MSEHYTEKLSKLLLTLISIALIAAVCWYFRSVIIYIILAAVIALIGRPIYKFLSRLSIGRRHLPGGLAAALTIISIFGVIVFVIGLIFPVVSTVISDISAANLETMTRAVSAPLYSINQWLIHTFPKLGYNFKIENFIFDQVQGMIDVSIFSSMVGSLASFLFSLGVTVFAMIFISFFFIRNPKMFSDIIVAFVPERLDAKTRESLGQVDYLISRYFIGLITEVLGVSLLNFLGLLIIAKMGFKYSIGIAFMTGLLNIIPYVGPLVGGAIGVSLSIVIKYACATSFGLAVSFPAFLAVLVAIFVVTQLVDNYVYQPLIYSNSIKAHPLEIFIVLLMAGHVGGMAGMLVAIPGYTVIRVFAVQFFGHKKAIRMLTER